MVLLREINERLQELEEAIKASELELTVLDVTQPKLEDLVREKEELLFLRDQLMKENAQLGHL